MPHIVKLVNVVIAATRRTFGKRVEHRVTRIRRGLHDIEDIAHRNAAPLGDPGPSLDAEMSGDLLLLRQGLEIGEGKIAGQLHQSTDAEAVLRKLIGDQRLELRRVRRACCSARNAVRYPDP